MAIKHYSRSLTQNLVGQLRASGHLEADSSGTALGMPAMSLHQIDSVSESTVFDVRRCGPTGCQIAVHVGVEGPMRISYWKLILPWSDPTFAWLLDPSEIGGDSDFYTFYRDPPYRISRHQVLNHRRIVRGEMEGLLLGTGFEPIPDSFGHGSSVDCKLIPVDPMGLELLIAPICLWVDRSAKFSPPKESRRRSLFEVHAEGATKR